MAIPSVEEILQTVNKPTPYNLCETVCNQISCQLLKCIFNPDRLNNPNIEPQKDIDWSSLNHISEAVDAFYSCRMPITLFGDFHQLCVDRPIADKTVRKRGSQRRNKGIYYTPAPLVDYIVFHTLKKAINKLEPQQVEQLRILDPSCGCGAFLIASLRFILEWFRDKYNTYLTLQESFNLLESMFYGTDTDERGVEWTRRLLLLSVWDFFVNNGVSKNHIRNLTIPTLKKNIVCMDFLQTHLDVCEKPPLMYKPFHIIIGGPPFVRVQQLYKSNPELADDYKQRFRTAKTGQFDLYMLFIEKAVALLANQGYLSMSVSNTFLRSESGRVLRKLIAETCTVGEIVEFEDSKLYPNALVQVSAIMLHKTVKRYSTKHIFIKGKGGLRRKLSQIGKQRDGNAFIQIRNLPATACASENWLFESASEANLLSKIESVGTPLGKLPINIRFGAATGADNIFLLRNSDDLNSELVLAESRFLDDVFTFESSVLKPVLRGRHIKGHTPPVPKTLCIFPYNQAGNVIAENVLRTKFPRAYQYLISCREQLNSRKLKSSQPWYAFRSEDISRVIQSPKLVASVVNSGGGFTLDEHDHIFCNNSVIILCPDENVINSFFLLAVLNSNIFKIWTQYRMPTLGSGWCSYRVNIMRRFPIPIYQSGQNNKLFSTIANLARELLCGQPSKDDHANILSSIDCEVGDLYRI